MFTVYITAHHVDDFTFGWLFVRGACISSSIFHTNVSAIISIVLFVLITFCYIPCENIIIIIIMGIYKCYFTGENIDLS